MPFPGKKYDNKASEEDLPICFGGHRYPGSVRPGWDPSCRPSFRYPVSPSLIRGDANASARLQNRGLPQLFWRVGSHPEATPRFFRDGAVGLVFDGEWAAVMIIRKVKVEGETRATCYIMKFECQPDPSPDIAREGSRQRIDRSSDGFHALPEIFDGFCPIRAPAVLFRHNSPYPHGLSTCRGSTA